MKQYLVTGGAGFIGSHITSALLRQGASVRVLDDFSSGRPQNLEGLEDSRTGGHLEVLRADLRDAAKTLEAVRGVEVIFHEAAFVSVPESLERPQHCFDVNITGTSLLLEAARQAGVRRIVIASSAAVYGEASALPLTEETELQPISPYAVSKRVDEMFGELYTQRFGLEVTALRYFNVYGPRQSPESIYAAAVPIFVRSLLHSEALTVFGDGRQTRDLIYVGDVVRANLLAAEHPAAAGQVFNVCTGQATSILTLVDVLRGLFPGAPQPVLAAQRAGDIRDSVGAPSKANAVMGFRAGTSLAEGLRETVEWMQ